MKDLSKDSVTWLTIDEDLAGGRLDNFLVKIAKGVPKSHLYRIIRSGEVRVNSRRAGADYKLGAGDTVRVPPIRVAEKPTNLAPAKEFSILFEDEALLVVDKPAGVAVHGGSGVSFGVIEQLRQARPQAKLLELAHRLDRETSGIMVIAKKRAALTKLHDMFREGRIAKRYQALVLGRWLNPVQHVKLPLLKTVNAEGERHVLVSPEGKPSYSIVRLKARWENFSLVEVELKTGRTHQIRVHLAHLGFQVAGDSKYGDFSINRNLQKTGLKRMFLHAGQLSLSHPLSELPLTLESPLPVELAEFLKILSSRERQENGEAF
ncbi:MAG: RluA family pseudouridine synthase [Rhodocyclaceae bacterium]|nr:RluA family pseudouridine synthase [Rhodocyclaceae bacterium]